jgi:hypothetical protein
MHRLFYELEPPGDFNGCIVGRYRAHTVGGGGAGVLRNLITLLGSLPPITKLIRNEEETVRYIKCAYGA